MLLSMIDSTDSDPVLSVPKKASIVPVFCLWQKIGIASAVHSGILIAKTMLLEQI